MWRLAAKHGQEYTEKGIAESSPFLSLRIMVALSLEIYFKLTDGMEAILDQADFVAESDSRRCTQDEVSGGLRRRLKG